LANHRGFPHARLLKQQFLDFTWVNVESPK
jgi:hypothetical protein